MKEEVINKRINYVVQKYSEINNEKISLISECDPTPSKKYLEWIAKIFLNGSIILPEDKDKVLENLQRFETNKQEIPENYRDINKFKNDADLSKKLDKFLGSTISEKTNSNELKNSKIVYKDNEWEFIKINNQKDLIQASQKTRWCTKDVYHAENYLRKGHFYLINRNGQKCYLFHPKTNSIHNVRDGYVTQKLIKELIILSSQKNIFSTSEILDLLFHINLIFKPEFKDYLNIFLERVKKNLDSQKDQYVHSLLVKKIITEKNSGDFFYKCINKINSYSKYDLFINNIVNKKNSKFQEILNTCKPDDYYSLLREEKINKNDCGNFFEFLKNSIDDPIAGDNWKRNYSSYAVSLLIRNIITKDDGELYSKALEKLLMGDFWDIKSAFENKAIEETDKIYQEVINNMTFDVNRCYDMIMQIHRNTQNGEFNIQLHAMFYNKILKTIIDSNKTELITGLIVGEIITENNNPEIFNYALKKILENNNKKDIKNLSYYHMIDNRRFNSFFLNSSYPSFDVLIEVPEEAYYLIIDNKITKENGDYFLKALEKILLCKNSSAIFHVLDKKIITKEDGEIYNKFTNALIKSFELN